MARSEKAWLTLTLPTGKREVELRWMQEREGGTSAWAMAGGREQLVARSFSTCMRHTCIGEDGVRGGRPTTPRFINSTYVRLDTWCVLRRAMHPPKRSAGRTAGNYLKVLQRKVDRPISAVPVYCVRDGSAVKTVVYLWRVLVLHA